MKPKKTAAQKRAGALERKYIDRAILRLVRTLAEHTDKLTDAEHREILGLARARRRVP
jgi:hypothetical protein